jgi:hypothetical protein
MRTVTLKNKPVVGTTVRGRKITGKVVDLYDTVKGAFAVVRLADKSTITTRPSLLRVA